MDATAHENAMRGVFHVVDHEHPAPPAGARMPMVIARLRARAARELADARAMAEDEGRHGATAIGVGEECGMRWAARVLTEEADSLAIGVPVAAPDALRVAAQALSDAEAASRVAHRTRETREPYDAAWAALRAALDQAPPAGASERAGLPVIQTCGQCAEHMPIITDNPVDYAWCGHDGAPGTESYDAKTSADASPPSWCPLRSALALPGGAR
jgi:bacterioferritin-associated ferredoxin